ncbi:20033_t:CDS:2, partial [Rhizophagus irregularis]
MDIQELSSPLIPIEFYNNTHDEPLNNFFNENMNTKDNLSDVSDDFISEENDGNLSLQKGQTFETFFTETCKIGTVVSIWSKYKNTVNNFESPASLYVTNTMQKCSLFNVKILQKCSLFN